MERRTFIALFGTVSTAGIAGCSAIDDSIRSDTPEDVARSYFEAIANDEYEEARSYTTGIERQEISETMVAEAAAVDLELESITDVEESGSQAALTYVISAESELGSATQTGRMLLIEENGEWLVTYTSSDDDSATPEDANAYVDGGTVDVSFTVFEAMVDGDYETVSSHITDEANIVETAEDGDLGDMRVENYASLELEDIQVTSATISESEGTVELEVDYASQIITESYEVQLEQVDDDWLVSELQST